ncbi:MULTISPECIES: SigE family RNA polymerase sigma factor [Dactylosporangium]|uniref:RNA polymerase n=2 Tax=Dactylosporangium TaxID=35753 RepID=A0A9W6KKP7_9ACTN|nr:MULTISPECIES: SigE family RNA polymerase sigma factor [Dactylosporangium]UAB94307.1 SigE family RNA polymerase sigma factor [Dactylosporangium vinaceum]UWZ42705.1 SigE family RNA polymerase sigma factor [Dactylosporangium matsuzakiense]GLL03811.1 RNA polymerase [Dactylosporangium matsuzakiense]
MTFEEFVHSRGAALVRFARLLTGDEDRADDLVQDVLAKAFVQWRRIVRADRPDVYVRRMLVNANASWWRKRANGELAVAELPEGAGDRDIGTEIVERDRLWRLVVRLPLKQRTVLVLRYYEDLDDQTIAEILDCSPITVRTNAQRALAALRVRTPRPETETTR